MNVRTRITIGSISAIVGMTLVPVDWFATAEEPAKAAKKQPAYQRPTVPQARSRAKLLHDVYTDTLDVIHRDYFRKGGDRKVVPSRALETIFQWQKYRTKIEARWLAVNANVMHTDHEPQDDFEKAAVRALASGQQEYELATEGRYRRAVAVPLNDSCLKCHLVQRSGKPRPRVAALVISMPVKLE
jgi:hypothetical protein